MDVENIGLGSRAEDLEEVMHVDAG